MTARAIKSAPQGRPARNGAYMSGFRDRLLTAIENNPNVPPMNKGRLMWFVEGLEKRGVQTTRQSASRWLSGVSIPEVSKLQLIADMLQIDASWLEHGNDWAATPRERRAFEAQATGAVNVTAGLIQMDGGTIAFPDDRDREAERHAIHLYAIIRGVRYAFHVTVGEVDGDEMTFAVPHSDEVIVLGLLPRGGFAFDVFEIPGEVARNASLKRGKRAVTVTEGDLRRITTFAERL